MMENKMDNKITKRKERVNDYEITINGTECRVAKYEISNKDGIDVENPNYDNIVWEGEVLPIFSAIEVYHTLTVKKIFYLKDTNQELAAHTVFGSYKGEDESTKELLAYEHNCEISNISVKFHKHEIYKHEILQ